MTMDSEQQIDQLRRRLNVEAGGPLADIANQATRALARMVTVAIRWIRRSGQQNPLITFLLACGAGFVAGRRGGRHA